MGRHGVLVAICVAFFLPFTIMLLTSFKTPTDIFHVPPRLLPVRWVLSNFRQAFAAMPFGRYLGNSVLLVVLNVGGTLLSCPLVAYALAKLKWPGRNVVFTVVLGAMMLPPQVTMVPVYLIWSKLGLVNTSGRCSPRLLWHPVLHLPATSVLPERAGGHP